MANAVTSRTSSVNGTVVTHKLPAFQKGAVAYLKYTKGDGTSVAIKFAFIDPDLDASDEYEQMFVNPTNGQVMLQSFSFSADGKYRIPLPMQGEERTIVATVVFTGGTTQALVVDFRAD